MTVSRAVRLFAAARPPGIYKEAYLADLFAYHHEVRACVCAPGPVLSRVLRCVLRRACGQRDLLRRQPRIA